MLIKYQALSQHLQKKSYHLYVISGDDPYLSNDALRQIKAMTVAKIEHDQQQFTIQKNEDWSLFIEQTNTYSLFYSHQLIELCVEKKSIDQAGKTALLTFLSNQDQQTTVILKAPNVPMKQLQWLPNDAAVLLVQIYPFNAREIVGWISQQFKLKNQTHEPKVPELIQHYTQGNMLATAQLLERLDLVVEANTTITEALVKTQLIDQCDYQLFELSDACLTQDTAKSIHLLRQAAFNKTEPTLILWLLTQDIRQLLKIHHCLAQSLSSQAMAATLKIWPQKIKLYEQAVKRHRESQLQDLLLMCATLDHRIKTTQGQAIWIELERLAIKICG